MARKPDFDLASELAKPNFTPGQRDAPALVEIVVRGEDPAAERAAVALASLGDAGRRAIEARLAARAPSAPTVHDELLSAHQGAEPSATDAGGATTTGATSDQRAHVGANASAAATTGATTTTTGATTTTTGATSDQRAHVSANASAAATSGATTPHGGRAIDVDVDDAELSAGATARLVGALGLAARRGDAAARVAVISRVGDAEVRVRRAAILALGKLGGDDARDVLIARWDASNVPADERRSLAEALGKIGGDAAKTRLQALDASGDAELARRRDRALLMNERDAKRGEDSAIAIDVAPPAGKLAVRLRCKAGLAALLIEELRDRGIAGVARRDDSVDVELTGPWSTLGVSRLWVSGAIRVPLKGPDDPKAIIDAITSDRVRGLFRAWTRGPIRWRLGFPKGHKRAVVWNVAKEVTARAPEMINDPTQTTWDILVAEDALEILPRRAPDPRFAWRVAEVPAASHPTVAAALAYVAQPRDGERVWDPFVGSGAELVECARLAPGVKLLGTDLDDEALAAARKNIDSAQATLGAAGLVGARLARGDARNHDAGGSDLIITNPPLGSRVQVDAAALLVAALPHFARQLAPRTGRLVWITPAPRHTTPVAEQLGLKLARSYNVDLGGVRGQLERWERR